MRMRRFLTFKVGAALEDADGRIFTGCNVENATYGLTLCAERVAVFKAISEGARKFTRVAVVADTGHTHSTLWRLPADSLGILRRRRNRACESARQNGNPATRTTVSKSLRCIVSLVALLLIAPRYGAAPCD